LGYNFHQDRNSRFKTRAASTGGVDKGARERHLPTAHLVTVFAIQFRRVTGLRFRFDSEQPSTIVQAFPVGLSIIGQAALLSVMIWYVLPNTIFSDCLKKLVKIVLPNFPDSRANSEAIFAYLVGYGLTLFFLAVYVYVRYTRWLRPTPIIHLTDKIAIFNGLYLLDFFLSTAEQLPFALSL
jgi:hypothetical protein